MTREKELLKNTIVLGLGQFLPKFVLIITLPIITACLTKSEYGTYDLITTLISLLMPVATLQLQSAGFRFLIDCRNDLYKTTQIITNLYAVVIPVSIFFSLGIILFLPGLSAPVRIVTGIYFFLDSIQINSSMLIRGLGNNKLYSASAILLSLINCIGIVLSVQLRNSGLFGVIFSLLIANLISILFLFAKVQIWKYISLGTISKKMIRKMVAYSWPMVPNNLSNWVLRLSDRVVITAFLGIEANAVYAVATKIPGFLSIAQGVLVMAWQENASIALKDEDAAVYYTKIFNKVFSLMVGITAILISLTPVMFKVLIRGDYGDAYDQIPILIFGMFFSVMSAFQGGIYIAHKRTKSVGITTIIAAGVNLLVDFLLIQFMGITAGSISTVIAYLILYILRLAGTIKFQLMNFHIIKQITCCFLILVMLFICFQQNLYLNIVNGVFGLVVFFSLNAETLKEIFQIGLKGLNHGNQ